MKKIISIFTALLFVFLTMLPANALVDEWPNEEHDLFYYYYPCFKNAIDENGKIKEGYGGLYYFCTEVNKFFPYGSTECPFCHNKAYYCYEDGENIGHYYFECSSMVKVYFTTNCNGCIRALLDFTKQSLIDKFFVNGERMCQCGEHQTVEENVNEWINYQWQTLNYVIRFEDGVCTDWKYDKEIYNRDAYYSQFTFSEKTVEEIEAEKAAEETKPEPQKEESIWDKIVAFFKRIGEFIVNIFTF